MSRSSRRGREQVGFAGFVNNFTSKPTIAAVNGNALGGGTELLLACDLAVAVETANVGLPEVKRGLMAGAGGAFRIGHQLPHKVALELLLTGRPMSATDAATWGLINKVVPAGQALDAALELANEIAANAPLSVQSSKRVAYLAGENGRTDEVDYWKLSDREIVALLKTGDALEGPTALCPEARPGLEGALSALIRCRFRPIGSDLHERASPGSATDFEAQNLGHPATSEQVRCTLYRLIDT